MDGYVYSSLSFLRRPLACVPQSRGSSFTFSKAQFASDLVTTLRWEVFLSVYVPSRSTLLPFFWLSVLPPEGAQTFQLWLLCLSLLLITFSSLRGVGGKVFQESSINVRAEEPWIWVSFHQPINYLLSVIKAVHSGSLDVPFDLLSGVIVNVDLFWRFCFNELLINLLGLWGHPKWRLDLFVVLTGQPELNILIAIFRF